MGRTKGLKVGPYMQGGSSGQCRVRECDSPAFAKGYCSKHFQRWKKHGTPEPIRPTDEQRFLAKVGKADINGCTEWLANRDKDGYGKFTYMPQSGKQKKVGAHRWAYEHWIGAIPAGMLVLHSCDNPPCVNLEHLRIGTSSDNKQDELRRGRNNPPRGTRNPRAVLNEDLVRQIRSMYVPRRFGARRIARTLGLPEPAVKEVVQGNNWRQVA